MFEPTIWTPSGLSPATVACAIMHARITPKALHLRNKTKPLGEFIEKQNAALLHLRCWLHVCLFLGPLSLSCSTACERMRGLLLSADKPSRACWSRTLSQKANSNVSGPPCAPCQADVDVGPLLLQRKAWCPNQQLEYEDFQGIFDLACKR